MLVSEMNGIRPVDAGRQDCHDLHSWGPGVRQCYIIHYIISGKGTFTCGKKTYTLTAGQSFLICPEQVVQYAPDENEPWEYVWVDFVGEQCRQILARSVLNPQQPAAPPLRPSLHPSYKYYTSSLQHTPSLPSSLTPYIIQSSNFYTHSHSLSLLFIIFHTYSPLKHSSIYIYPPYTTFYLTSLLPQSLPPFPTSSTPIPLLKPSSHLLTPLPIQSFNTPSSLLPSTSYPHFHPYHPLSSLA